MTGGIRSIGFVGLGDMGAKQAHEIAKLPVSLSVFDVRREAMEPFKDKASLAEDLAAIGSCDVVGICVQTDAQVQECVDAVLPVMTSGSVILVHATVRPATVIGLAEQAEALGIALRDAPVTRTRLTENGPFVFCPMGGDAETKARVQPILDAFATDTMLAGPIGSAMALKICNNLISWCEIAVALEALSLADAAGLEPDALLNLTGTNGLLTPPMKIFAGFMRDPQSADGWQQRIRSAGVQGRKDLALARELASERGAHAPMAGFAEMIIEATIGRILQD